MKGVLLISLLLLHTHCPAQLQTIYYETGQKAIEGKWRYASTLYLLPSMLEYAYHQEMRIDQPAAMNKYIQPGLPVMLNSQLIYDGPITVWYRTGEKKLEITFVNGIADGPCKLYYTNGKVADSGSLLNGVNNGVWSYYAPDGKLFYTGTYRARNQAELAKLLQDRINYTKIRQGTGRTQDNDKDDRKQQIYFSDDVSVSDTLRATIPYRALFVDLDKICRTEALRNGLFTFYYPSGDKKAELIYSDDTRNGIWSFWRENRKRVATLQYDRDNILAGTDSTGKRYSIIDLISIWKGRRLGVEAEQKRRIVEPARNNNVFRFVEQMPTFDGDREAYFAKMLRYPRAAEKAHITGRVTVEFIVLEDGSITDAKVIKGVTPELNAEAVRIVKGMPNWKPGKQNGQAVKCYFTLPIIFKLD